MAATKVDALFQRVADDIKDIVLEEGDKGLTRTERLVLAQIALDMTEVWNTYLDRLIVDAAAAIPNPKEVVAEAGADVAELEAAQERVYNKLEESGVLPKKPTVH